MIKGLHHVALSVANLDRSMHFYRDLLGMELMCAAPFEGAKYEQIMRLRGAKGRSAMLRLESMQIEIFEFAVPASPTGAPSRAVHHHGITHFCLEVTDIDGQYRRLAAAGVEFHCPPLNFFGTAKATYGRDPDGNVFELLESIEVPAQS